MNLEKHLILENANVMDALLKLDNLAADAILFVVDEEKKLIGSLTDGDVRRGLLKGLKIENNVEEFIQKNPKFIYKNKFTIEEILLYKKNNYKIIPVLNDQNEIINVVNFRLLKSYLPIDAILMAGGRGERLRPLTDNTPKPLLKVGDKPIIEHNIDNLINYGIDDFHISVKYLGEQIESYFGNGLTKGVIIDYIWEVESLGTIGAVSKIEKLNNDYVIVSNSDLLTDLNYEDLFLDFINKNADAAVVTIPYNVSIPYAVLELENNQIKNLKEKPTYTYYSNGGIYLMKKEILEYIPKNSYFNATDLLEKLILINKKVISYPLRGYWLDIGQHEDYNKAQEDIKHLKL